VIIEQAKGLLAGRLGITVQAAFEVLRRYARGQQLPVREVSRRVVAGELPMSPSPNPAT
jgi:AmiR/NasT family two-component response regulator